MPRTKGKLTKDEIVSLYATHSVNQIAELDGTSYVTVLRILHRADVKMRPKGNNGINPPVTHGHCSQAKKLGMTPYRYVRLMAIVKLGGVCNMCGIDDLRVLDLNHINGQDAPQKKAGTLTVHKYKEHLAILAGEDSMSHVDVLCSNCNRLHEFERGNLPPIPEEFYAYTSTN